MHIRLTSEIRGSLGGRWGLGIIAFLVLLSLLSPFFHQGAVNQTEEILAAPSATHWLGTNEVGQDIFSRLVLGTGTSLIVAVGAAFLTLVLGAAAGVSAGLAGGIYERLVMRLSDAMLVTPAFVLLVLLSAFVRPGILTLVVFISILRWPVSARVIRARTRSLMVKEHVHAARGFGANKTYIVFKHVLPDLAPVMTAFCFQYARAAVFMETGLAFLGITDPGMISWGTILHYAFKYYYLEAWAWWLLPCGIMLSLFILSLTMLGYSVEKFIEPRLRHA
jgi:peptide/nickel transport system permease protein